MDRNSRPSRRVLWVAGLLGSFGLAAPPWALSQETEALGPFNVLTRNYNNQRTGANTSETVLDQSNVNSAEFGKLFQYQVDDQVYAGILYASNVTIGGQPHNVIYVATVNNTVYAFDADTLGPPLWQRNFNGGGRPTRNTEVGGNCNPYRDFSGNIGIVGTPVIDGNAVTMFLMARTVEGTSHVQRLRAIDIATGNDRAGSPAWVTISASGLNTQINNQRPALALANGVVYIGFSSFCDTGSYHGILLAYDAGNFAQTGVFNVTPSGTLGGIWMAGAAPAFDGSGNLFLATGNGSWNGTSNFGESMLKLAPRTLGRLDWFTPSNWSTLNGNDWDFGSSGPIFLPGTNLLVGGGKDMAGKGFLLNGSNLGNMVPGDTQSQNQVFQAVDTTVRPGNTHHLHNSMVAWTSPAGVNLYVWGENDRLRAFRLNSSQRLNTPAFAQGTFLPPIGMPGGLMALSADGSAGGTGILWATTPRMGDANQAVVPGVLHAYDAESLGTPLWTSGQTPGDDTYNFAKGSPPVVANGKVYVGSLSNVVSVFGNRTTPPPSQNLALNRPGTSSTPCNANEGPAKALNGSYSGGNTDKWCSAAAGTKFLQVDLGSNRTVNQVVIEHAGAGGESFSFNTRAYNVQVSLNATTGFTQVASMSANIQSITTHNITPTTARYVRLNVTTPTQTTNASARIYELQVFGQSGTVSPTVTHETEDLFGTATTSGDTHRIALDAGYSGGEGTILEGNAAGDFVSYTASVPEARTYNIRVRIKRLGNRGIFQLSINGTNVGSPVDGYSASSSFPEIDLGNMTFTSAGNRPFRFQVTGKNASSTNFWIALDYIRLIPQ